MSIRTNNSLLKMNTFRRINITTYRLSSLLPTTSLTRNIQCSLTILANSSLNGFLLINIRRLTRHRRSLRTLNRHQTTPHLGHNTHQHSHHISIISKHRISNLNSLPNNQIMSIPITLHKSIPNTSISPINSKHYRYCLSYMDQ